ncbi:NAD(P)-dependent oxidoreductase [Exiguobacterium antarcticum]|uniref:NAD(P)-dependent oxidoreductase n=1 Tax=Exiguobacterium antarcticum TaxID=132920 RepID=UPI000478FDA6|nr:NAD(P)-dependent oxidoreductase [Exiguobacterium antarcticum]
MKIAIIGASGKAGRIILEELAERGHALTAIVRDSTRTEHDTVLEKNAFELTTEELTDFDVVINAFGAAPGNEHQHVDLGRHLIDQLRGTSTRLIIVGGAGSLYVDPAKTVQLADTPDFPAPYLPTAKNQAKNLTDLQQTTDLHWTFISPAAFFDPAGERTGQYQLAQDVLTVNAAGDSYVSYSDYAIALADEVEHHRHDKERISVVSK